MKELIRKRDQGVGGLWGSQSWPARFGWADDAAIGVRMQALAVRLVHNERYVNRLRWRIPRLVIAVKRVLMEGG